MEIIKVKYINQDKDLEIAKVKFEDFDALTAFTNTITAIIPQTDCMYFKSGSQPNDVISVKQGDYISIDKYGKLQEFTKEEYNEKNGTLSCIHEFSKDIKRYPRRCVRCKEIESISINIILNGENFKALKVTRGNLGEVEWFTDGEIKCQTESFTQSGECEIWCYKGGGVFWINEGGYFLKNEKGDLEILTELQFEALPTIDVPKELSLWEKFLNLFNIRR